MLQQLKITPINTWKYYVKKVTVYDVIEVIKMQVS